MKHIFIPTLLVSILFTGGCRKSPQSNPQAEQAAITAAKEWLSLVDTGDYAKSWDEAAVHFKNAVPKDQWGQTAKAVREPLDGFRVITSIKTTKQTTTKGV